MPIYWIVDQFANRQQLHFTIYNFPQIMDAPVSADVIKRSPPGGNPIVAAILYLGFGQLLHRSRMKDRRRFSLGPFGVYFRLAI